MEKPEKGNPNQRLKRARQQHGWSQEALAERIGAHEKNVSKWERGISSPGPYFQEKLCELFGMSAVELGFFKEEANGGSEHVSSQPPDAQDATVENNSAITDTHEGVSESTLKKLLL